MIEFKEYIRKLNNLLEKYILPKPWTPAEEALYKPYNLFEMPIEEANQMKFKAIKYSFKNHYENNAFYHKFCKENDITPDDIKSMDDLIKIPLLPDNFFKDYPAGKDFALWLANIFTGKLPNVIIDKKNPSFDDVIESFNKAGMLIAYSSGTSGKHTIIPRDRRTWLLTQYALAKTVVTAVYPFPFWEKNVHAYWMMSNPFKTNIFAGKIGIILYDIVKGRTRSAINKPVTANLIQQAMTGGIKSSIIRLAMKRENKKMINRMVKWFEEMDRKKNRIAMLGAPFILYFAIKELEKEGKTYNFGERGAVVTGGGWKIYENERISVEKFRKKVNEVLGIPEEQVLDLYGMVEGNGWMIHCPEKHYLHVPMTYYHPIVLDKNMEPAGDGEEGRFAFLDALSSSYPSFVITGDNVKMHSSCKCGRNSAILEPEVTRARGKEMRGCAEEMRKMLATDLSR